jgi:hypothetical protein
LCKELGLTAISGTLLDGVEWSEATRHLKPDYLPRQQNGSILLCKRDISVAVVCVNFDSFYGTSLVGGNHDWSIGELKMAILNSMKPADQRSPYNPGCVVGS